jgi:CheY-like chemotaxis protein
MQGDPGESRGQASGASAAGREGVTLLCVDDEKEVLEYLRHTLTEEGYRVVHADSREEAAALAEKDRPDLICMNLTVSGDDGYRFMESLRADPRLRRVPVIVISADREQARALSNRVRCFLSRPFDAGDRLTEIRSLFRERLDSVLIVEDDADTVELLVREIAGLKLHIQVAGNGREGLQKLNEFTPSLVILDLILPVLDGFEFLEILQLEERWRPIPVILLTGRTLSRDEMRRLGRIDEAVLIQGKKETLQEVSGLLRSGIPEESRKGDSREPQDLPLP